ncbi:hypothetical protein BH23CHL4_BH23CHL4_24990 [soil metagenome]
MERLPGRVVSPFIAFQVKPTITENATSVDAYLLDFGQSHYQYKGAEASLQDFRQGQTSLWNVPFGSNRMRTVERVLETTLCTESVAESA